MSNYLYYGVLIALMAAGVYFAVSSLSTGSRVDLIISVGFVGLATVVGATR